ncbi:MAG: tRNA (adenosine(37)-N6)-threonylcarbamoyltransferase complex ATPase subunit type 1 TsaE [Candidatus Dependentiae bacterium]|nr:tRNA (adenosine(37)-N6)-threonylcarbamoyltransferase complex ATPase subunit type 1 TsaE [Candidatus Dependentiae bacterium]
MEKIIYGLEQIDDIVDMLYKKMNDYTVFTFSGTLGAGKTTLVRALLRRCGIQGVITSPTFTYVNLYENAQGQTFYHFDAYRLKNIEDFRAAGFDEYLYKPQSWVFIEWPEAVKPLLTHAVCYIALDYSDDKRIMTIETKA